MAGSFDPAKTAYTRVFILEGRARPDHKPKYRNQVKMQGLDQSFGDVTNIYQPDPHNYGKFEVVGTIRQAEERPTTTLVGRYAADIRSELLRLAKIGCENDVQLHIGKCDDPSIFNAFQKAVIIEGAAIPSYSTDDLGALQPDEQAIINENADISGIRMYEVVPLQIAERAQDLVTTEVVDAVICDQISCGDCEELSDGCQKIFTVTKEAGGSPGTPGDVVWSLDGGVNFYARDIDTLTGDPTAVGCIGLYVVVTGADQNHHIALKSDFNGDLTALEWTEVTGYDDVPNDMWSVGSLAFVVGDNGYIWRIIDPTVAPEELDAGTITTADLNAVHALSETFAIAVGDNGAIVYTTDGEIWQEAPGAIAGNPDLYSCWAKSEFVWVIGGEGTLYYTVDGGQTFTAKAIPNGGGASDRIDDVQFPSESVGYLLHWDESASKSRLLRSYDYGYSWVVLPEGSGLIPQSDGLDALATCEEDPNVVVAVGFGTSPDGMILYGSDAKTQAT